MVGTLFFLVAKMALKTLKFWKKSDVFEEKKENILLHFQNLMILVQNQLNEQDFCKTPKTVEWVCLASHTCTVFFFFVGKCQLFCMGCTCSEISGSDDVIIQQNGCDLWQKEPQGCFGPNFGPVKHANLEKYFFSFWKKRCLWSHNS